MGVQNQVLGRGALYFELYAPGTFVGQGERHFGNTQNLTLKSTVSSVDEYDSISEIREKGEVTVIQRDLGATFVGDDISNDNLNAWFAAYSGSVVQGQSDNVTETITVFKDRWYQLGKVANPPMGIRNVAHLRASIASVNQLVPPNFTLDRANGRVYVKADAPAISGGGTAVLFTYDVGDNSRTILIQKTQKIRGALRFISDNGIGKNTTYYFPYVTLKPEADFQLKTDDWQKLSFSADILKMSPTADRVYTDAETISNGYTNNEESALTYGTESQITGWANKLDHVFDIQLPSLNYDYPP